MTDDTDIQALPETDREAREAAAKAADYEHGWSAEIDTEFAPKGLDESTVRFISAKKGEPEWLLEWRLQSFRHWQKMREPHWAKLRVAPIDYQGATYYSAPKQKAAPKSLDEVDPELLRTYEKLGIPLAEMAGARTAPQRRLSASLFATGTIS